MWPHTLVAFRTTWMYDERWSVVKQDEPKSISFTCGGYTRWLHHGGYMAADSIALESTSFTCGGYTRGGYTHGGYMAAHYIAVRCIIVQYMAFTHPPRRASTT
jgi:hypothetical protein